MPPARTGIATYDVAVLEGLRRIGFTERVPVDVVWPVRPHDVDSVRVNRRLGVFQVGNNIDFHLEIYRACFVADGLLVLHDLAIDDFVKAMMQLGDPLALVALREAMRASERIVDPDVLQHEPLRVAWCAGLIRRARGIIVHADFCRRYLRSLGCRTPIWVVPHPAIETSEDLRQAEQDAREIRAGLQARGVRSLIVSPGDVNPTKQLDVLARATAHLDASVYTAVVGRTNPYYDAEAAIAEAGVGDRMGVHANVSDEAFLAWVRAADIVVDLRHPHRGEVSGSLIRAMQAGRPTIVSATGTYLDAPRAAVRGVRPGPTDPDELEAAIRDLLEHPQERRRMGEAAARHVGAERASEATAMGYEEAIEATMTLVGDPAFAVESNWARGLLEVGVTEGQVRAGYGVAYVEALRGFMGST